MIAIDVVIEEITNNAKNKYFFHALIRGMSMYSITASVSHERNRNCFIFPPSVTKISEGSFPAPFFKAQFVSRGVVSSGTRVQYL